MGRYLSLSALASVVVLSACGHSNGGGPLPTTAIPDNATVTGLQTSIVHGNFTEYTLPAGAHPYDFTKGPYNTLWFDANNSGFGTGYHLYRFNELTGAALTFSKGSPWEVESTPVATGSLVYFITLNTTGPGENPEYLSNATYAGALATGPTFTSDTEIPSGHIVVGPDGRIWYPDCLQDCASYESGDGIASVSTGGTTGAYVSFPDFAAHIITPGPSGYLYATATFNNALPPPPPSGHDSAVFVVSTTGHIVHTFYLPNGSAPFGIATGSDHNLWIAEAGINKIARMTPSGTITQFSVPTAGAQASWITNGVDGALWFTESHANKIGRVTTTGVFHEWTIPTANTSPQAIQYCYGTNCGTHGGVWYAEPSVNRIGKFISPL